MTGPARRAAGPSGIGDLAIVLHSHMPYVEGFGTYPFGEEWLFDAVVRSYLPVLEVARDLTMTVTPVLADQLEDTAVRERLRRFLVELRIDAAEADAVDVPAENRDGIDAEAQRYRDALRALDACGGDVLGAFRTARDEGRIALMGSAATHAVLPLLATRAGLRLQLDAGLRSHRRRFGWDGGVWLPECAYVPGLEWELAEHGISHFCVDQSASEAPLDALAPVATDAGPVVFTIDWEAVSWLWSASGYPAGPDYLQFAAKSMRGMRLWRIGGGAYDSGRAAEAARRDGRQFIRAAVERLGRYRAERGRRGLIVFAVDTELIGHWWSEGPAWLAEVLDAAPQLGLRLLTLPQALAEHPPERRPLAPASWGEGKDFRTWDAPEVADLAWGARRSELRLLRALGEGLNGSRAARAARELLALQASDWAFLDARKQAGDYPFQRATGHARAMLEAIDSP
ncbi:MAG: 1,4-alpha-glucan branching protein domain-containing protein, partial [Solirubrobacterales bacterium]